MFIPFAFYLEYLRGGENYDRRMSIDSDQPCGTSGASQLRQGHDAPEPLEVIDVTGTRLHIQPPVRRVVSLVPSITETFFALGAGERLVGRTRYCIHPAPEVMAVEAVGGTKDPKTSRIVSLAPDIVLANREENRREDIDVLRAAGIAVHVCEPLTPSDALSLVALYATMLDRIENGVTIILRGEATLHELGEALRTRDAADALRLKPKGRPRVACFIWRDPWMAAGSRTYINGVIETLGGVNVYADLPERYPKTTLAELTSHAPDIVLLPGEPYPFAERHVEEVRAAAPLTPASRSGGITLCNGEDLCWFGSRTPDALARLRPLLA